jgi:large subunit ribosomal protein L7/L12
MVKREERISTLEARLKQLKAEQAQADARRRAVASRRGRKDELRRKILVGAVVLERIEAGEFDATQLWAWLDRGLTRQEDRELLTALEGDGKGLGADG